MIAHPNPAYKAGLRDAPPVNSHQPTAKNPVEKRVLLVRRLQAVDGRMLTLLTSYCRKPPSIKRKDRVDMLPDPFSFPMPETRNPIPAALGR